MESTSLHMELKGITGTVNYAVYIYVKLQITAIFFYFLSISPINPNHFINLLREIHGNYDPTPTPNHRMYHPPSYNTHTLKGPPPPTSNPQGVPPTNLQHHTLKGPPTPYHRKFNPPSYNTHTLKVPLTPHPDPQPTRSTTHHLKTLIH